MSRWIAWIGGVAAFSAAVVVAVLATNAGAAVGDPVWVEDLAPIVLTSGQRSLFVTFANAVTPAVKTAPAKLLGYTCDRTGEDGDEALRCVGLYVDTITPTQLVAEELDGALDVLGRNGNDISIRSTTKRRRLTKADQPKFSALLTSVWPTVAAKTVIGLSCQQQPGGLSCQLRRIITTNASDYVDAKLAGRVVSRIGTVQ